MPIDYKKYPANWKTEIRPRILERAQNRCELCGVENYTIRDNGSKVVLTIAHFYDHSPQNCTDENPKALCQRCHLRHDAAHHTQNARLTREKKAGLQRIF